MSTNLVCSSPSCRWLIGEDKALDPRKYFIVIIALFGNGQSSSPSNMEDLKPFPKVTFYDNVRAQHELVSKHLDITHAFAVLGWSMGAGQTFQWATQYPGKQLVLDESTRS